MKRGTIDHPKTCALAKALGMRRYAAVGLLESLWHFTAQYAPRGDLGRWDDAAICHGLDWEGEPAVLIAALIATEWLNVHAVHRLVVHDWAQHLDNGVRERLKYQGLKPIPSGRPQVGLRWTSPGTGTGSGSSSGSGPDPEQKRRRKRSAEETPLPDVFPLTDALRQFAAEGGLDAELEFQQFKDSARAHRRTYADWPAAFRYWCRNAHRFDARRDRR